MSNIKLTTEEFIKQAKNKHNYDYSQTVYNGKLHKIKFICPIHEEVWQYPKLHLKSGCPFCNRRGISKHTKETFIQKANQVHNSFYHYDKVIFNNINEKVIITCPIHGDFNQKAANHINLKNGCPKCKGGVKYNQEYFIEKANSIHNNKFNYNKTNYINSHKNIIISCKKHGDFEQLPYSHLNSSYACPSCIAELDTSISQKEIFDFLKEFTNEIELGNRDIIKPQELDIYLPNEKLAIEYNGLYWHNENVVNNNYHKNKTDICEKNNIKLIHIFEHEWKNKKEIVKSRLKNLLKLNNKIYARKCKIIELTFEQKNNFLNRTHIQGIDNTKISIGLTYNDNLVAVMTFGKPRFNKNYDYELIRYSSELNINVVGGASKLLSYFRKNYQGTIVTYADRKWSNGNMYEKLGFKLNGITNPGFFWYNIKTKEVANRMKYQKHKMSKLPIYDNKLSMLDNMKLNGYVRVFDVGDLRFIL